MRRTLLIIKRVIIMILEDRLRKNRVAFAQRRIGVQDFARDVADYVGLAILIESHHQLDVSKNWASKRSSASIVSEWCTYPNGILPQNLIRLQDFLDILLLGNFKHRQSFDVAVAARHGGGESPKRLDNTAWSSRSSKAEE